MKIRPIPIPADQQVTVNVPSENAAEVNLVVDGALDATCDPKAINIVNAVFGVLRAKIFVIRGAKGARLRTGIAFSMTIAAAVFGFVRAWPLPASAQTKPALRHDRDQKLKIDSPSYAAPNQLVEYAALQSDGSAFFQVWLLRTGFLGQGIPEPVVPETIANTDPTWRKAIRMYSKCRNLADFDELTDLISRPEFKAPSIAEGSALRAAIDIECGREKAGADGFEGAAMSSEGKSIKPFLQYAAAEAFLGINRPGDAYRLASLAVPMFPASSPSSKMILLTKAMADFAGDMSDQKAARVDAAFEEMRRHPEIDRRTIASDSYKVVVCLAQRKMLYRAEEVASTNIEVVRTLPERSLLEARLLQIRGAVRYELGSIAQETKDLSDSYLRLAKDDAYDAFVLFKGIPGKEDESATTFMDYGQIALSLKEDAETGRFLRVRDTEFSPMFQKMRPTLSSNDLTIGLFHSLNSKYYRTVGDLKNALKEIDSAISAFRKAEAGGHHLKAELGIRAEIVRRMSIAQHQNRKTLSG